MKIICLMGPTASGKTALAVELVQAFPFELISVDSAMIYRGMDIGTAKPEANILNRAPHRLIDIRDPSEAYSAADFCQDALREIKEITSRGKIPLLVGGTMMYFHALHHGLATVPSNDTDVRLTIAAEGEQMGWGVLHQRLQVIDPKAAARIHPHDRQRIQRALEVYTLTGKPLSSWHEETTTNWALFNTQSLIIAPENRSTLHHRIETRFLSMIKKGFIEEVKTLYDRGDLTSNMPAIRAVGYRQVWEYLSGNATWNDMCARGIAATRQLAKRQLTWLRRFQPATWFESDDNSFTDQVIRYLNKQSFV